MSLGCGGWNLDHLAWHTSPPPEPSSLDGPLPVFHSLSAPQACRPRAGSAPSLLGSPAPGPHHQKLTGPCAPLSWRTELSLARADSSVSVTFSTLTLSLFLSVTTPGTVILFTTSMFLSIGLEFSIPSGRDFSCIWKEDRKERGKHRQAKVSCVSGSVTALLSHCRQRSSVLHPFFTPLERKRGEKKNNNRNSNNIFLIDLL